jgi:hypothetical protein
MMSDVRSQHPSQRRESGHASHWVAAALAAASLPIAAGWLSDAVTLDGHWSIYTLHCERGTWRDHRCTGRLRPAERYSYVASKETQSVRLEVHGRTRWIGGMDGCRVVDGRTWSCNPTSAAPTVALEIKRGVPTVFAPGRSGDELTTKARWLWLRALGNFGYTSGAER